MTGNLGVTGGGINPMRGQNNIQGAETAEQYLPIFQVFKQPMKPLPKNFLKLMEIKLMSKRNAKVSDKPISNEGPEGIHDAISWRQLIVVTDPDKITVKMH